MFENEPLDEDHPLWQCSQVIITPHISAPTPLDKAVEQIVANIDRIEKGDNLVSIDRSLGY